MSRGTRPTGSGTRYGPEQPQHDITQTHDEESSGYNKCTHLRIASTFVTTAITLAARSHSFSCTADSRTRPDKLCPRRRRESAIMFEPRPRQCRKKDPRYPVAPTPHLRYRNNGAAVARAEQWDSAPSGSKKTTTSQQRQIRMISEAAPRLGPVEHGLDRTDSDVRTAFSYS